MNDFHSKTKKESFLLHCKDCRGVLVKNIEPSDMKGWVSFLVKCPHCKNNHRVNVGMTRSPTFKIYKD